MTLPARSVAVADEASLAAGSLSSGSGALSILSDVGRLARPRIALMVLATVATAAWVTAAGHLDAGALSWVLAGTLAVAASSSVANQILERDTDRLMPRTAHRPIAAGRLAVREAWMATALLLVVGLAVTFRWGGAVATLASLVTWALYVLAYTPLKRLTPLNTAVGAIAGALPVAIGWGAAGGPSRLAGGDVAGAIAVGALATVLYLWQFPHFMAIAWLYRGQYASAGLRMLTVVDPGGLRAAGQALAAALAMVPVSLLVALPSASVPLFLVAAFASTAYVAATIRFAVRRDDSSARGLLFTSLLSLLSILVAAVACGGPPA